MDPLNPRHKESILHASFSRTTGTGESELFLRSAGTRLSLVRDSPWLDGAPESLISPCCGLAGHKTKGHGGVADEHQVHINTYDGDDGLLDDPQTNSDTNDEGSHDGLLDDPNTKRDTNGKDSHDGLIDDPQTNGDTNEGVREECKVADGQPLQNNDFMNLERLILCLAENENTSVYKELPEG
ncbi:hypothetical protein PoB_000321200 [Plakobranchus ocellatus]|uniref:Uncharacterized protein n=1 Tax=Plakobranchus ocellatus TaxID=259542 RepID=A0AAV3Y2P6_9GAST|nr:hypothetical protein PoB_000321200 [Plakobranchus ocellatus]